MYVGQEAVTQQGVFWRDLPNIGCRVDVEPDIRPNDSELEQVSTSVLYDFYVELVVKPVAAPRPLEFLADNS